MELVLTNTQHPFLRLYYLKMRRLWVKKLIIEKRKQIREVYKAMLDRQLTFNACTDSNLENKSVMKHEIKADTPYKTTTFNSYTSVDWDDDFAMGNEATPGVIVHIFAILTGLSAFAIGSYFFAG